MPALVSHLRDCLTYMRQVTTHTMDYVNTARTNILSPNILPVEELRGMLRHIKSQLQSTMHLPILSNDTLQFHWYLKTHVPVADGHFSLLIDVPILDRAHQLQIYRIFNLPVPNGTVLAQYKINDKYIGVTWWNASSHDYRAAVLNMPSCKWTFLQNRCIISSSHRSTIMHSSLICKEW